MKKDIIEAELKIKKTARIKKTDMHDTMFFSTSSPALLAIDGDDDTQTADK